MFVRHFRFKIIIRIILLTLTLILLLYLAYNTDLYATMIIVVLIAVYQIYSLINLMESTNRRMTQFLEAVRHADFSQTFKVTEKGKSFRELNTAFTEVMNEFQRIRSEKEEHFRYLQTVVQHIGVGLIAYDQSGKIELMNTAAKRLLGVSQIGHIEALNSCSEELVIKLKVMKPRTRDLIKIQTEEDLLQLAIYTTEFRLRGRSLTLASIQNIQSELEEQEMEAWQKLIRVLTHEIMNSITPISSLAKTTGELLSDHLEEIDQDDTLPEIQEAIHTIQKRSEGLLHFVESYRQLTRIPKPNFQLVPVDMIFKRVLPLVEKDIMAKNIIIVHQIQPEGLTVLADVEMIEQVLINLIKNSVDALNNREGSKIMLSGARDHRGRVIVKVSDNGPGIAAEAREKIFIPFFTTKKTGTGIGLSLSRQIMRQHLGSISVTSKPNEETAFKLIFS